MTYRKVLVLLHVTGLFICEESTLFEKVIYAMIYGKHVEKKHWRGVYV